MSNRDYKPPSTACKLPVVDKTAPKEAKWAELALLEQQGNTKKAKNGEVWNGL